MPCSNYALDLCAIDVLHRASRMAIKQFNETMGAGSGLTPRHLAVLQVVAEQEAVAAQDAGGARRNALADVQEVLGAERRHLMRLGLVRRRRAADNCRTFELRLSPAGREVLGVAEQATNQLNARLRDRLGPDEHAALLDGLALLARQLRPQALSCAQAKTSAGKQPSGVMH